MNIFADENIPQQIVTQLRAAGHKVEYVMQQVEDRIILEEAYKQQALLITSDKDFGRLVLDEGKGTLLCRTGDGRHDAAASGTYAVERSVAGRPSRDAAASRHGLGLIGDCSWCWATDFGICRQNRGDLTSNTAPTRGPQCAIRWRHTRGRQSPL